MTKKVLTTLALGLALTAVNTEKLEAAPLKHKVLRDGKVSFTLDFKPRGGKNELTIIPNGFKNDNAPTKVMVNGIVTDARIKHLDKDSYPELVIFTSDAMNKKDDIIIFSSIENKMLTRVVKAYDNKKIKKGYRGRDQYTIRGNKVVRTFPIYKGKDSDDRPSGGLRTVTYGLGVEEASKVMTVKSVK